MLIPSSASDESQHAAQELFSEGLSLFQEGKLHDAAMRFTTALSLNPKNIDALNLAGICAYQNQEYESALHFLNQAIEIDSKSPYTHNTIGLIEHARKQYSKALERFDIALGLQDNIPEIYNNRGNTLKCLSNLQQAIESYQKALQLNPNYFEAFNNLGVALKDAGKPDEALTCFDNAIKIHPSYAEAFNNAGTAFESIGNYEKALQCYGCALQINPSYIESHMNCGNLFKKDKNLDLALQAYQRVISISPNHALAHYLVGEVFYEKGDSTAAQENYQLALNTQPDYPDAKFALAIATIPKVLKTVEDIKKCREKFSNQLEQIEQWLPTSQALESFTNIGAHQPFYLAYQELDNKNLLTRFGKIGCDILKDWQLEQSISFKHPPNAGPIRLGIASAHFSDHPVWHAITKGLLTNLDRNLFEVHLFNLGKGSDGETEIAKRHCTSYIQGKQSLSQWANAVIDSRIEVLLFPEVGMDPLTRELASLRLAPIQMAAWGHPETTGLPTMDYFISGQDIEPVGADENYSEKLIKLPNLGCFFECSKTVASNLEIEALGLSRDRPILLCPGSPSKYSPENDWVLVEIAKRLGECQLVFFDFDSGLTHLLRERLEACFQKSNLRLHDYAKFIPFQSKENFYSLMRQSDIYLDTIGFSGFNTAMQAIECNLPVITREGKFMRGRLASGILKRMGMPNLVVNSNNEYVYLAVDLIQNKVKIKGIQSQLNEAKKILFNDLDSIRTFEKFLLIHINQ